jgi:hypothetical protein
VWKYVPSLYIIKMLKITRNAKVASLFVLAFFVASCAKRDENLITDYNAKKASAETLITEVNTGMEKMKTDHAAWEAKLTEASAVKGADTARINGFKNDIAKHNEEAAKLPALVDSTKLYTNASTDNDESLKFANDRLTENFDDLNNQWKSVMDEHHRLESDITAFLVNNAGDASKDSTKAAVDKAAADSKTGTKTGTGTVTKKPSTPAKEVPHDTKKHTPGGTPRDGAAPTPTTNRPPEVPHDTKKHTPGGTPRN